MYKESFLDKQEAFEIQIIKKMYILQGMIDRDELAHSLKITVNTLSQYIDSINQFFSDQFGYEIISFLPKKKEFSLDIDGKLSLESITEMYLEESINYQILLYIYNKEKFDVERLYEDFSISRAVAFRRIAKINEMLEEFDIRIQNGRIQGNEQQIRYFFFLFFQNLSPQKYMFEDVALSTQMNELVEALEEYFQLEFHYLAKERLLVWLRILMKRKNNQATDKAILDFSKYIVENNRLFVDIEDILRHFFQRMGMRLTEFESNSFYQFLTSFCIIPNTSIRLNEIYLMSKMKDDDLYRITREVGEKGIEKIYRTDDVEKSFTFYYLYNVHSQAIFFKGYLYFFGSEIVSFYNELYAPEIHVDAEQLLSLSKTLEETYLPFNYQFLSERYAVYLYSEEFENEVPVRVGVALYFDPMVSKVYTNRLRNVLSNKYNVSVEEYVPNSSYEIIVTNIRSDRLDLSGENLYYLTGMGTDKDFEKVEELVHDLLVN